MTAIRRGAVNAPKNVLQAAEKAAGKAVGEAVHAADKLRTEPFWQAQAALVGALILYLTLPSKFVVGPTWLMPAFELLLIGGLWLDRPRQNRADARRERRIVLVLLALVALANFLSMELLVHYLLQGGKVPNGHALILSAMVIWLTNVAVFALAYWQLDRGGPDCRTRGDNVSPDLWFPQNAEPHLGGPEWRPAFVDYMYTSFTAATAFSPTDTMPITARAKLMMMAEALISLVTLLLVAARAVNILA
jgi:uncharacterized membrane protein